MQMTFTRSPSHHSSALLVSAVHGNYINNLAQLTDVIHRHVCKIQPDMVRGTLENSDDGF